MVFKNKNLSRKSKKTLKDTPPPERYARIIAEQVQSQFELMNENLGTIKKELSSEMQDFAQKVFKEFARVDMRFFAVDKRFDAVDKRFEAVDKRFEAVDKRFEAVDKRFEAQDKRFDKLEKDLRTEMQNVKTEIKEEIQGVEVRLSEKIDSMGGRVTIIEDEVHDLKTGHLA